MISRRILTFAVIVVVLFVICPALLDNPFPPFPLLHTADVIEFLTPFLFIAAYWSLFAAAGEGVPSQRQVLVFLLLSTLWVVGVGAHLAGNSIQHLMDPQGGTPAFELAKFFHKPMSHYTQSVALMGLSTAAIYRESGSGASERHTRVTEALSAIMYGFAFFCLNVSGKIAPLGMVYSAALIAYAIFGRRTLQQQPVFAFFLMAQALYLVLCIGWLIHWHGMPNFVETGFIK